MYEKYHLKDSPSDGMTLGASHFRSLEFNNFIAIMLLPWTQYLLYIVTIPTNIQHEVALFIHLHRYYNFQIN